MWRDEYPKTVAVRDGRSVVLRPMVRKDEGKLLEFFRRLPACDRQCLKDNITDAAVIHGWAENLDYERVIPILAEYEGRLVGDATLHRTHYGWSRHVAEIRLVTDAEFRQQRLGRALAREIFYVAQVLGVEKVVAMMMEEQVGAIRVFAALGFEREAVLKNHVLDVEGTHHDLIMMSEDVAGFWKHMEDKIASTVADQSGMES